MYEKQNHILPFFVPAYAEHIPRVFESVYRISMWPWELADHVSDSVPSATAYLTCISKKQNSSVIAETQLITEHCTPSNL